MKALVLPLLVLAGCGVQDAMMLPNPPPKAAVLEKTVEADEVTVAGTVSAVSSDTRSWVQVGDGQTVIGHLPSTGVLSVDGRAGLAGDLVPGMLITSHGHQAGDLVVVWDAKATSPAASAAALTPALTADGTTDPAEPPGDGTKPAAAPPAAPAAPLTAPAAPKPAAAPTPATPP